MDAEHGYVDKVHYVTSRRDHVQAIMYAQMTTYSSGNESGEREQVSVHGS
jgi:hypothetical protein